MTLATPNYLHDHVADAAPGHHFGLYYNGWNENFTKPKDGVVAQLKNSACKLPNHSRQLLAALSKRQKALSSIMPQIYCWPGKASAPFATGLGNEHPLENGFAFLTPYGLPYLPGSGVKGVIRRAAQELASGEWPDSETARCWDQTAIDSLLGSEDEEHIFQGALRFWDVYPAPEPNSKNDCPLIGVEIMTPHLGEYYQGKSTPNTSLTPIPIPFLAILPKSQFNFYVECQQHRLPAELQDCWQALLAAAFAHAGTWLGFGAKTAVGYGRMTMDPAVKKELELQQEKERQKAEELAEKQRQNSLPPAERLLALLASTLDKFNGSKRTNECGDAWNNAMEHIKNALPDLQSSPPSEREQIAGKLKALLTTKFKVEGKAEKFMKEQLNAIRNGQ